MKTVVARIFDFANETMFFRESSKILVRMKFSRFETTVAMVLLTFCLNWKTSHTLSLSRKAYLCLNWAHLHRNLCVTLVLKNHFCRYLFCLTTASTS